MVLGNYGPGDRVFVSLTPDDWMVVEVVPQPVDDDDGNVAVRMLYAAGVPGYEAGGLLTLDPDLPAYRELTVDTVLATAPPLPGPTAVTEADVEKEVRAYLGERADVDFDVPALAAELAKRFQLTGQRPFWTVRTLDDADIQRIAERHQV
jgi:hypothetical protein